MAQIPLENEWTFVVRVACSKPDPHPPRSLLIAGARSLISVLDEVGPENVAAIYQMWLADPDDPHGLVVNRLAAVYVSEDSEHGGCVFTFETEDGDAVVDSQTSTILGRLTNRVEVIRLSQRGGRMRHEA